jgi:protein-tyrosine-phosphatase
VNAGQGDVAPQPSRPGLIVEAKRVLFLCNGNSARSQMAEAFLRHVGRRRFEGFSAGANPAPEVHPLALETLRRNGVSVDGLTTKDLATFAGQAFDFVISLCDRQREQPSVVQGADMIYWTFRDPAESAEPAAQAHAFEEAFRGLERRIRLLIAVNSRRSELAPYPIAADASHSP